MALLMFMASVMAGVNSPANHSNLSSVRVFFDSSNKSMSALLVDAMRGVGCSVFMVRVVLCKVDYRRRCFYGIGWRA